MNQENREEVMDIKLTQQGFEDRVKRQIQDRNRNLANLFNGDFPEEPKLNTIFRFHAKIVTHEGDVILAQDSENYWRKLHTDGAKDFTFELKSWVADTLKEYDKCGDHEVNYVVFEITKFKFRMNGEEFIGFIDPVNKHRKICTQDP